MARIDQQSSLPTYSYRSLDGKVTGPKKTRLIKNIITLLLCVLIVVLLIVKYTNVASSKKGVFPLFNGKSRESKDSTSFTDFPIITDTKTKRDPSKLMADGKAKDTPLKKPEKFKTGSPLDAFLSGFVDPAVASQMLKFLGQQAIDPVVSNLAPALDKLLPPERISIILRTINSISSGELSGLEAIKKNYPSILESSFLLILNVAPELGGILVDDIVSICDRLSDWMEHTELSVAKYIAQFISYIFLPLFGFGPSSLEQASRIIENGISQLLPDISSLDRSIFKSKERLIQLAPPMPKIQQVIMSIFVQMASLRALQASVNSFSGSKASAEDDAKQSEKTPKHDKKRHYKSKSRHHRDSTNSDNNGSYFDD